MKTFYFAYWVASSAPVKEKDIPTDGFRVYADDLFTACVNGWAEMRTRIKALGGNPDTTVAKISINEI